MRLSASLLILSAFASLAAFSPAPVALAGVLLPDDSDNKDSQSFMPNLGLGRFFGLDKKSDTSTTTTTTPAPAPSAPPQTLPKGTATEPSSVTQNAQKIMSSGMNTKNLDSISAQIRAEVQRRNQRAPIVMSENAIIQSSEEAAKLPYTFTITVDRAYYWGTSDLFRIAKVFGYTTKDVQDRCIVRLGAEVITTKGEYHNIVYPGQQVSVKYDGAVQTVNLDARAVCDKPSQLPQTGGTIEVVGSRFATRLGKTVTCIVQPPITAPTTLQTSYLGDGKGACKFN